jgi:hypothetical protein
LAEQLAGDAKDTARMSGEHGRWPPDTGERRTGESLAPQQRHNDSISYRDRPWKAEAALWQ